MLRLHLAETMRRDREFDSYGAAQENPLADADTTAAGSSDTRPAATCSEGDGWRPVTGFVLAGRTLTCHPALLRFWQLMCLTYGSSWGTSRALGWHTVPEEDGQLASLLDLVHFFVFLSCAVMTGTFAPAVAPGGGLEQLHSDSGSAGLDISPSSRKTLHRWSIVRVFLVLWGCLPALGILHAILFEVGTVSGMVHMGGGVLTPLYAVFVLVPALLIWGVWLPVVFANWVYALQCGCIIATESVERVIVAVQGISPSDASSWQSEVVQAAKRLASVTLPALSSSFGATFAVFTVGQWIASLGQFASFLAHDNGNDTMRWLGLFNTCTSFCLPLVVASTAVGLANRCNRLLDAINCIRGDHLDLHLELAAVETFVKQSNCGVGLGFVSAGQMVDLQLVKAALSSLVAFLVTVVPIILTLQGQPGGPTFQSDGKNNVTTYAIDPRCDHQLDAGARAAISAMVQLVNSSCSFNLTITPNGAIFF